MFIDRTSRGSFLRTLSMGTHCSDGEMRLPDNDGQPPVTWEINSLTGGQRGGEGAKSAARLPVEGAAGCFICFN